MVALSCPGPAPVSPQARRLAASRTRTAGGPAPPELNQDPQEHLAVAVAAAAGEDDASHDGATAAALRDATATASSSGHDHHHHQHHSHHHASTAAAPLHITAAAVAADGHEAAAAATGAGATTGAAADVPSSSPAHRLPAHVTPERDRELHDELASCEDWRDVLDVLADEASQLSVRTASQALTRLNGLTRGAGAGVRAELLKREPFQALLKFLFSQVASMNNVQLSNTLQALAQLQVPLGEGVLAAYWEAAFARRATFFPRDISTFFGAAAALRASPPMHLLDALSYRAQVFMSSGEFDHRGISTLLHSCVLLGFKNHILAATAAQVLAQPGMMRRLAPQGVANSLWALARMGVYDKDAVEAALECFAAAPLAYKPQECANMLWALTAFRHHPEGRFILFARSLLNSEDRLRAADLATLFYALATFNALPSASVLDRLCAAAAGLVAAGAANTVELVNMYWGLALLGEGGGGEPSDGADKGGSEGRPLFRQLELALVAHVESGGDFPVSMQRMVFQGFLASRLSHSRRAPPPFSALTWDSLKRAWINNVTEQAAKRSGRKLHSAARLEVSKILKQLRIRHDAQRLTGDNLAVIDFALKSGTDTFIALQLLEAEERCANSKQLLGNVVLQRQLLEKNGWEVRFLPAEDLFAVPEELRPNFVAELLRRSGMRLRTEGPAGGRQGERAEADSGAAPRGSGSREMEALSDIAAGERGPGGSGGQRGARGSGGRR
ncbi:hypothetical protein GPECTOR_71g572 [Gonium pectorale]|uniref:RAP domain-containing protein n=1 Tax=Gonium pectorale TaxID=33097 RepID=A0A150G346_GONPE|nr:hypothetical protein GPECTOR_71g572 [Gonium pectorale]|eukprot:KXZ44211.1 hypothetical protein GPECTOR_71g572 [Gonium pectorale]